MRPVSLLIFKMWPLIEQIWKATGIKFCICVISIGALCDTTGGHTRSQAAGNWTRRALQELPEAQDQGRQRVCDPGQEQGPGERFRRLCENIKSWKYYQMHKIWDSYLNLIRI